MLKSNDFSMQSRTILAQNTESQSVSATMFGAFVMRANTPNTSETVQVELNADRSGTNRKCISSMKCDLVIMSEPDDCCGTVLISYGGQSQWGCDNQPAGRE